MTTPEIITPTIGRKVWYRHDGGQAIDINGGKVDVASYGDQPMDATVIYVWHDRMVNLRVTDHAGNTFALSSVTLVQQGDATPSCRHCEWMPYQKGQTAKAEASPLPVVDPGPDSLEREIRTKADKGPRVTPVALQAEIVSEHYFTAADGVQGAYRTGGDVHPVGGTSSQATHQALGLLTFCVLVLRNGFTVHGVSACASPENYNKEIGERIARENAERQIWPLLGFRLRDQLSHT